MKKDFTFQGRPVANYRLRFFVSVTTRSRALTLIILLLMIGSSTVYSQNCQLAVEEITGPPDACAFILNNAPLAVYTVKATDASGYLWTIPALAKLVSGQGTNTIQVRYKKSFTGGEVSVSVSSACGGPPVSKSISVGKLLPAVPAAVLGPTSVCEPALNATPVSFAVDAVPNATQYLWYVPSQTTIISGQGTATVQILFSGKFKFGNIKVRAISGCGKSGLASLMVSAKGPAAPGGISGKANGICGSENVVEYNIIGDPNALSYNWTTTVQGAIITNQGTKAIIAFPSFSSGIINVIAVGRCGVSSPRRLNVSSAGLTPESIIGPISACPGSLQSFSVEPVDGAIRYDWTLPEGSTIESGNGTPSITVRIGLEGGPVTVRAATACDPGTLVLKELALEECENETPDCELDLFPVPTPGILHVRFCTPEKGAYHLTVTHLNGCGTVFSQCGNYEAGESEFTVDLSNLKDGCYLVNLKTSHFSSQERIEIKK